MAQTNGRVDWLLVPTKLGRFPNTQRSVTNGGLNRHLDFLKLLLEPLAGDVEPPLDGSDRRPERIAHFDEGLAIDVERDEGVPIELAEPFETGPHLPSAFVVERGGEGSPVFDVHGFDGFGLGRPQPADAARPG